MREILRAYSRYETRVNSIREFLANARLVDIYLKMSMRNLYEKGSSKLQEMSEKRRSVKIMFKKKVRETELGRFFEPCARIQIKSKISFLLLDQLYSNYFHSDYKYFAMYFGVTIITILVLIIIEIMSNSILYYRNSMLLHDLRATVPYRITISHNIFDRFFS